MSSPPFANAPFCLLDIETTGLSPAAEEITEIAVIRVDANFGTMAEMSRLIRIARPVSRHITRITGITDGLLRAEGKPLALALEEVHRFTGGRVVFAHNARFDRDFLNACAERTGMPFRFSLECSIPLFKRLLPGRKGYGLPALAEALRVDGGGAHRALADCRVLLECLKKANGLACR